LHGSARNIEDILQQRRCAAERSRVKHIIAHIEDVPPSPHVMDARVIPDRRTVWRGGRRDTDWTTRPRDAWNRLNPAPPLPRWRMVLSALHLLT
jgi:hypothetical protein